MKYLCMCYESEAALAEMPESNLDALLRAQVEYAEALEKSGRLLASEALESVQTATTIRVRNGKMTVTDGPFAETKEQFGGFFLIEASDLNDAIRIASRFPSINVGSMEIRPVWEIRKYVRDLNAGI